MPLSADTLIDRLHLKRQISRWRLIAVLAIAGAALLVSESYNTKGNSPIDREFIARIRIDDVILDNQDRNKMLDEIRDNKKVKAVIVQLNTPGGSAVAGEETYLKLKEISAVKPTVAVMREVCASAGYMIAIAADHIIARQGTITGSIGVLMQMAEMTELAQKIGITPITVKSAPLKGSPSPFEKTTPESRQAVQNMIDDFYAFFVDIVAERRKLPREQVLKLADGRVYSGNQAVKLKLIDAIGGEQEALAWLEETKKIPADLPIRDMEETPEEDDFTKLFSSMAQKIMPKALSGLDGLVAIWHPELQLH